MGEMRDKMCVWGSAHRINNGAESFHASLNRELKPKPGLWAFMKKMQEKISRTLTDLERVKNGVPVTRPKTVSETQRWIAETSAKLETGQLTVEEFINKMKYVGWKGVKKKQGNNVQAEADLPEADLADGDLDVDLQDINVDLLDVSLQDINAEHHLQDMLADSPPRTMPTYTLPRTRSASSTGSSTARTTSSQPTAPTLANYTPPRARSASSQQPSGTDRPPRRGRAARSTAAGSLYRPPVTRSAARTETSLRIQVDQEVVAQEEDAPVVAAQEVAGQEAAAKKKFKRCAVCLQENISVTRPIYLVPCGHGDICKECAQKVSTKNCHLCRAEIFTFVQAIAND
ncbi:uncharacterized protein LOC127008892 isoform X3 [Eriocheir sinensis]|uniref:uncharacterized protein LOC127008892 isoform X2 n=1 Tax=Eriocheir sinensis TaxID=95602 RepID=UPI0021C79342|nr:uncharacterized protein LOC127008892 isoform X2 [Eriocheir sinensis]XP_050737340.1 uncharacterized protein LOC127008892 isoform X3 [Eriocheir sinensis]